MKITDAGPAIYAKRKPLVISRQPSISMSSRCPTVKRLFLFDTCIHGVLYRTLLVCELPDAT